VPPGPIIGSVRHVEIHFHLLPGIDDGPSSIDESVALGAAAVADGTGIVLATPHVHPAHITDPAEIPQRVRELAERLRLERIELELRPGGELCHEMVQRLSDRELETIANGPPRGRWLLLEAPFDGIDERYTAAADELRARGFGVVVAHPERSRQTSEGALALLHELALGSAMQLTAWSFDGYYGAHVRMLALRLLRTNARVVIASDAHGRERMPSIRLALGALAAAGVTDAGRFAGAMPRALLEQGLPALPASLVA